MVFLLQVSCHTAVIEEETATQRKHLLVIQEEETTYRFTSSERQPPDFTGQLGLLEKYSTWDREV
ncbi:hypothetical protein ACFLVS_05135 [Chloroflexota bacterium]